MSIRTLLISALFLAISCVSVQANVDTQLNVASNTASDTVLLMALSGEQDQLDDLVVVDFDNDDDDDDDCDPKTDEDCVDDDDDDCEDGDDDCD